MPIHWGPHTPFRSTGTSLGITEDGASGQASVHGTVGDRESTCKNCSEQRSHEGTLPDYHALSGQSWGEDGEPGGPHTLFNVCCQPPRGGSELHVLSATQRVMPRTSGLASVGIGTIMENPRHPEPPLALAKRAEPEFYDAGGWSVADPPLPPPSLDVVEDPSSNDHRALANPSHTTRKHPTRGKEPYTNLSLGGKLHPRWSHRLVHGQCALDRKVRPPFGLVVRGQLGESFFRFARKSCTLTGARASRWRDKCQLEVGELGVLGDSRPDRFFGIDPIPQRFFPKHLRA